MVMVVVVVVVVVIVVEIDCFPDGLKQGKVVL